MPVTVQGKTISLFTLFGYARSTEKSPTDLYREVRAFIQRSEAETFDGILLPDSNAGNLTPWFFADQVYHHSSSLHPFIAVNPVYVHPFYLAKQVANLSLYYDRRVYLNYITGTGLFEAQTLGNTLPHDQKYTRLKEYLSIVNRLLQGDTVTCRGEHYTVTNLSLPHALPAHLLPTYYVAGNSAAARAVMRDTGARRLAMALAPNELCHEQAPHSTGFHLGILARPTTDNAMATMHQFSPEDARQKKIQALATHKSGAVWKKELLEKAAQGTKPPYCLTPFINGDSDVPYLTGSYQQVAKAIHQYLQHGITLLVIEIPDTGEDEFQHLRMVITSLKEPIRDTQDE